MVGRLVTYGVPSRRTVLQMRSLGVGHIVPRPVLPYQKCNFSTSRILPKTLKLFSVKTMQNFGAHVDQEVHLGRCSRMSTS